MLRLLFPLAVIVLASCKKVEIREVPVEKKTSWAEIDRFSGTEKIFLSSGSSADAIYLQQPFYFTELRNQDPFTGITVYGASLHSDVQIRIPIAPNFFARPSLHSETAILVANNQHPINSPSGGFFNIKELDSSITQIQTHYLNLFKCMTINKNGVLLLAYHNNRPGQPFTFLLLKIKTLRDFPYVDSVYSRSVVIPQTRISYVRHMKAVDDYFLLDLSSEGLFKIDENGGFRRVYGPATVDAFYEWKGKVYAHAEWDRILVSENRGESWQEFSGGNTVMTLAQYYVVKDSLVGTYRDTPFTLRWEGTNYAMRFLKNDGLENTRINGIEVLRDSVYAATTSGLYAKPLAKFFETK